MYMFSSAQSAHLVHCTDCEFRLSVFCAMNENGVEASALSLKSPFAADYLDSSLA